MKVPRQRIEAAVSNDPLRHTLHNVMLDGEKIVSCDGRLMVILPVEREAGDVDGMISTEAMTAARMTVTKTLKMSKRFVKATRGDVTTIFGRPEGTYPKWSGIGHPECDGPAALTFGFDPNLMMKMFSALAQNPKRDKLKIEVWGRSGVIRCSVDGDKSGAVGFLMPINLTNSSEIPDDRIAPIVVKDLA